MMAEDKTAEPLIPATFKLDKKAYASIEEQSGKIKYLKAIAKLGKKAGVETKDLDELLNTLEATTNLILKRFKPES